MLFCRWYPGRRWSWCAEVRKCLQDSVCLRPHEVGDVRGDCLISREVSQPSSTDKSQRWQILVRAQGLRVGEFGAVIRNRVLGAHIQRYGIHLGPVVEDRGQEIWNVRGARVGIR